MSRLDRSAVRRGETRAKILACLALCGALALAASAAGGASDPDPIVERVLDTQGLAAGWQDIGWAKHTLKTGQPAQVDFSGRSGWIFSHAEFARPFGGLLLRFRAPEGHGDFLDVRLDGRPGQSFPRVRLSAARAHTGSDGFTDAWLDGALLDPLGLPFSQLVLQATTSVDSKPVEIALVGFTAGTPAAAASQTQLPPQKISLQLDCNQRHPVSPLIYGTAGDDGSWTLGETGRRWGGNPTSTYNWELGNAWNKGADWFFRNSVSPRAPQFIEEGRAHQTPTTLTVPILGEVASDTTSCSFPVSLYGEQRAVAPDNPDCGNGVARDGKLVPPGAANTGVLASPEFIGRWITSLREADEKRGLHVVRRYILDNEPMLWHITHRDLHPSPVSYDELLDRTLRYATAIRRADPTAVIAGPALWGWQAWFNSAVDVPSERTLTPPKDRMDRAAHDGKPLLAWWLESVRAYEKKEGLHLIDLVDVHFYPQSSGVGLGLEGWTDAETSARRIRSVRGLWDPSYKDESWIAEPIKLVPRLRDWIEANAPGLGISIGEYNFGAENHISGGLAVAEALGRFGQLGVASAYYWLSPPEHSPVAWAFHAFRNYDGAGARFLDSSIEVKQSGPALASVFGSRSEGGEKLVSIVLNEDLSSPLLANIDLGSCGAVPIRRVFSYAGGDAGLVERKDLEAKGAPLLFPPGSINVVEYSRSAR